MNEDIFILAKKNDIIKFDKNKLLNLNNYTDTVPDFRSNLEINIKNGGFSSYQSEYPYNMIVKKGNIMSSIYSLTNIDAEENIIFFKNIYLYPIHEKFNAYIVDIKEKKILDKFEIKTNYTNKILINKNLIKPEIFLFTDKYIGIPMFVSIKDKHISFEHTHPPHSYILSQDRYKKISELKKEINEIIH